MAAFQPIGSASDVAFMSASALAAAIHAREVSSEEVVGVYLDRIETVNPALNAVVQLAADSARKQARAADAALKAGQPAGPLHGVPVTIKDQFDVAGLISTGGTRGRAAFVPERDATAVERLRAAGAIVLGKTNVPELSIAFETDNLIYGRTNNPYDLARTPGGSSGGEAAIIAVGGSALGLGTDAAGSIRWPAHCCGIAGLKPTAGRVALTGTFPPAIGVTGPLWQAGLLARFVDDLALALPCLLGTAWRDPSTIAMPLGDPRAVDLAALRVAVHVDNGVLAATPDTARVVKAAATTLADAGAAVEEARPAGIEQAYELGVGLFTADGGAGVQHLLASAGTTEVSPLLQRLGGLLQGFAMSTAELGALLARWDLFRGTMLAFLEQYDVIVCPVNAFPALPHGTTFDEDTLPGFSYSMAYNLTGWPAVVIRAGTSSDGLPIGVQVVARPWHEDVALAAARQIETVLGGWQPSEVTGNRGQGTGDGTKSL
jgi:amidase